MFVIGFTRFTSVAAQYCTVENFHVPVPIHRHTPWVMSVYLLLSAFFIMPDLL